MIRIANYWEHTFLMDAVRSNGTVFDFGLNYGGFASFVSPFCARVIGYEPDPRWKDNPDLPRNVQVIDKAVAAEPGFFFLNQNRESFASLRHADEGAHAVRVEAVTLRQALSVSTGRIELIKIDIEGAEIDLLRNAEAVLLQRAAQITVEFHDFIDRADLPAIHAIIARMRGLGFWVVKFSWHSFGDVLFVNQALIPLSPLQKLQIILVHKYIRGIGRKLRRALRQ